MHMHTHTHTRTHTHTSCPFPEDPLLAPRDASFIALADSHLRREVRRAASSSRDNAGATADDVAAARGQAVVLRDHVARLVRTIASLDLPPLPPDLGSLYVPGSSGAAGSGGGGSVAGVMSGGSGAMVAARDSTEPVVTFMQRAALGHEVAVSDAFRAMRTAALRSLDSAQQGSSSDDDTEDDEAGLEGYDALEDLFGGGGGGGAGAGAGTGGHSYHDASFRSDDSHSHSLDIHGHQHGLATSIHHHHHHHHPSSASSASGTPASSSRDRRQALRGQARKPRGASMSAVGRTGADMMSAGGSGAGARFNRPKSRSVAGPGTDRLFGGSPAAASSLRSTKSNKSSGRARAEPTPEAFTMHPDMGDGSGCVGLFCPFVLPFFVLCCLCVVFVLCCVVFVLWCLCAFFVLSCLCVVVVLSLSLCCLCVVFVLSFCCLCVVLCCIVLCCVVCCVSCGLRDGWRWPVLCWPVAT